MMKAKDNYLFKFCLVACLSGLMGSTLAANDKNAIRIKILENKSFKECRYSGVVTLEVKYKQKHFKTDRGTLLLESTLDGVVYTTIKSKEVTAGRGSSLITFDAGECTQDIRLSLK